MKKNTKKSEIITVLLLLFLISITQNFTFDGSDENHHFDTESNNPLMDPSFPKISDSHPYNDSDTIILCDFEDGIDDINGYIASESETNVISPGIEGDGSLFISYNYSSLSYDIPQENITDGTIECYFHPLNIGENSLSFSIMFVESEPVCDVYIQGNSLFAWHIAERNISTSPTLQSNTTLQLDVTYHIAYSFGSTGQKLYLDGDLVAESDFVEGMCNSTTRWGVGKENINAGAIGVYDMYKISKIQRTSFDGLPLSNPSFSSDDLYPAGPISIIPNDGEASLEGNESVGYAILCGIKDYPGYSADLQYTENDINDYKSFLQGKLHFQEENIKILLNSQGTISNINQAFDDVKSKMDENDYLFFTFSGHGSSSVETLEFSWSETFNYVDWQPWDMTWDYEKENALYTRVHFTSINLQQNQDFIYIGDYNNQDYYSTVITGQHTDYWSDWVEASHIYVNLVSDGQGEIEGLEIDKVECVFYCAPFYFHPYDGLENGFSDTDFENLLEGIPGKVISVFDSCFSGAFCRSMQDQNRLLFASCGDQQYALESSDIQNGVFTYEFLLSWDRLYQENMGTPPGLEQVFNNAKNYVRARSLALGYEQIPIKFDHIDGDVIVAPHVEVGEIIPCNSNNLDFSYSAFGLGLGQIEFSLYDVEDQNYITYSISNIPISDNQLNFTMPVPDLSDYECITMNGGIIIGDGITTDFGYYGDYSALFSEDDDWDGDGLSDYEEFLQGSDPWEDLDEDPGENYPYDVNNSLISGYGLTLFLLGSIISVYWIFISIRKKAKIFYSL